MKLGVRKELFKVYARLCEFDFFLRKFMFGFNNANNLFLTMDKRCAINILKRYGATIGSNCDIETPLIIHNANSYKKLELGNFCHIGKSVLLDLKDKITLNDFVTVSMNTAILTHFDAGRSSLKDYGYVPQSQKVILEQGCYLGAGSIILAGTTVGKYSIVAAGAVVTENVPSYAVVAGVPAKVIKYIDKKD
jgi:acetyltransferase-like isoleucine patch superfamily enzyme